MGWLAKLIHWLLSAISALIRRLVRFVWPADPPPFFRDWQQIVPLARLGPPPGPPFPPAFDPAEAKGTFIGVIMRVTVPGAVVQPFLPSGVMLPIEATRAGYL